MCLLIDPTNKQDINGFCRNQRDGNFSMKKKIFNVLFAVVLGVSFSLMAAPAIASSVTLIINENPSPVFPPLTLIPDQAYVIRDNVNYKLYYAGNDFKSINLAQSPDGITWTPYINNPIISDGQYFHDCCLHTFCLRESGSAS